MTTLLELAARVEAAKGQDSVLAREIMLALGYSHAWIDVYVEDEGQDPTISLDAAMTLVPEGWSRAYRWSKDNEAHAAIYDPGNMETLSEALGKTEALALAAAALKARAATATGEQP